MSTGQTKLTRVGLANCPNCNIAMNYYQEKKTYHRWKCPQCKRMWNTLKDIAEV